MTLGCAAAAAHADSITDYVHLEMGAGIARYSKQPDGVWYQDGMPHSLGLSAPVLMGGFDGPIWTRESWGIDWHIDYVSLGHVSSQCDCTPIDANYSTATRRMVANPVPVPNANFIGGGDAQGVALMIEPYLRYRGWRIGIDAGIFPYRPAWDETIYNWTITPGVAPTTISAHTSHAWQLGRVVGISVGRGPLSIAYQHYWLPTRYTNGQFPAIWKGADILMLTYRY